MTEAVDAALRQHLLRHDGQEDICLATYSTSTGEQRVSRLLTAVELPRPGDRFVHGNTTITGEYVLRVAALAAARGRGLTILHSHPRGRGWQRLSEPDRDAEASYAALVQQVTGLPLVGMTLAGQDLAWSAREWPERDLLWHESVRVVGTRLRITWNAALRPVQPANDEQVRTVSAWGERAQADIARARVLVVGAGSVGLDVAQRLAATGIQNTGVMDRDVVKPINRDRMIGATRDDARLNTPKVDLAQRLMLAAATATHPVVNAHSLSVCSPEGLRAALDYDVIFSCVDRPWPRAVLNGIAYADLIPVIDGGITIDTFPDGTIRGASWRVQTATPGAPCMDCAGQIRANEVVLDQQGLLDDEEYIKQAGLERPASQNVAALSAGVSAEQLAQFVSLLVAPAGRGVPRPLRFILTLHHLEHLNVSTRPSCFYETRTGAGDGRFMLVRSHVSVPADRDNAIAGRG